MRVGRGEHVEAVDLVVEDHLTLDRQPVDEVVDRLGAIRRAVVDGLHGRESVAVRSDIPGYRWIGGSGASSVMPIEQGLISLALE